MALSAETIAALREELETKLSGGRIDKIQQPERDLLLLTLRAEGYNRKLLIRAAGPNARIHLTALSYENPREAPMFCMLLRKHLSGARVLHVVQPEGDRILALQMESRNELGDLSEMTMVVEMLGRAANVILLDGDGRIIDCLHRVSPSEFGGRGLLPGLRYELPERPSGNRKKPEPENPALYSVSEWLDTKYGKVEKEELQRRRSQELVKTVRRSRDRQQRKLAAQSEELRQSEKMDELRQQAELLQANLYRVRRGDRMLECEDYYREGNPLIRIPLDPLKTPQQNLAQRFKEYRKAKGAREHLTVLIEEGEKQLDYLNSVLEELSRSESERDLEEIREELLATGFLKNSRQKKAKKGIKIRASEPLRFMSPDGLEILVGRNNVQNDELTTKFARRTDYWLHVKDVHGSHVIMRCEGLEPSPDSIRYAAELAAQYSQARGSGRVAVDYTMVRNVKKPSGALPGKVIYQNYKTILVRSEG